jgi:hypothetical protein
MRDVVSAITRVVDKLPRRHRLALVLVAIPLAVGLAVGAYSYLGSSLRIPGLERMAPVEVLRERGADMWVEFCGPIYEPRFWPECVGNAADERSRGADAFVAFCLRNEPARIFGSRADCLIEEQPPASLVDGPRPEDLTTGGVAAGVTFVLVALGTAGYWLLVVRARDRSQVPRQ